MWILEERALGRRDRQGELLGQQGTCLPQPFLQVRGEPQGFEQRQQDWTYVRTASSRSPR